MERDICRSQFSVWYPVNNTCYFSTVEHNSGGLLVSWDTLGPVLLLKGVTPSQGPASLQIHFSKCSPLL